MNNKAVTFIKNFSYTLTSNLISLIVSTLVVLVVPKLIGINEYGYWQLYLFYSSYVGFLHFGWNDGIYLRYGGKDYSELDKEMFFSQFYMLFFLQFIIGTIIFLFSILIFSDVNKIFILQMTGLCMIVVNLRYTLLVILQMTNRIKEYAQITMIDRIFYCALIIIFLLLGVREFKLMVIADLIGKFISLIFATYACSDIVFLKLSKFRLNIIETLENVTVGIKLMFANIASMLVIGVVRFGIEKSWDVATFAKISLTLSISNLMMLFINAVGIIMFPILRRTDEKKLPDLYSTMRTFLMVIMLGILIFYYPFKVALTSWLPQYADSLIYMALLFPMSVYEGKMALLISTYLKTLRKEKWLLYINLAILSLSIVVSIFTTVIFKNLNLSIASIVILLGIRCAIAEVYLSKTMNIPVVKDILFETSVIISFILSGWYIHSWLVVFVYMITYLGYVILKREDITRAFTQIKVLARA